MSAVQAHHVRMASAQTVPQVRGEGEGGGDHDHQEDGMKPTLEELEKALETLQKADDLGGRDPEGDMTVREALNTVFRATPAQLYEAGLDYGEAPGREI